MDLMSLKYFQFIAMYRNFSKAAQHFYLGQSALSRQMANLEKELGVQLFDRDTRNVSLTDAGRVLYENCDLLLRHHNLIYRLMDAVRSGHEGHLGIATVANFGPMITDLVRMYMAAYPRVKTQLEDIPFDELSDSILHGVYDLAFTLDYAVPENDQIVRLRLRRDRFVAVMSRDFPADFAAAISTEQLLGQHLIVPRHIDPPFLRQLRLAGRGPGTPAGEIEYVPNTNTALLQMDLGLGITFLPKGMLDRSHRLEQYRCCELADLDTRFFMVLIRRKDNTRKTAQNFVNLIRNERGGRPASR